MFPLSSSVIAALWCWVLVRALRVLWASLLFPDIVPISVFLHCSSLHYKGDVSCMCWLFKLEWCFHCVSCPGMSYFNTSWPFFFCVLVMSILNACVPLCFISSRVLLYCELFLKLFFSSYQFWYGLLQYLCIEKSELVDPSCVHFVCIVLAVFFFPSFASPSHSPPNFFFYWRVWKVKGPNYGCGYFFLMISVP